MTNYCGSGAGTAGLSALGVLNRQGFSVDAFEKSDRVGGAGVAAYLERLQPPAGLRTTPIHITLRTS